MLYRFTLYFITLDTGLSFGKISSPTPLGDPEVKVIDIELILKLLFIIMSIEYGHFCMMFSFCSASQPPPPHSLLLKYSRTSVARTLMARLPRLFRTCS